MDTPANQMTKEFWMPKLLPFLIPIETTEEFEGEPYEVKEKLKLVFLFEGGIKVSGEKNKVAIRFNDPDLLVLRTGPNPVREYLIPYSRLVGFEVVMHNKKGRKADDDSNWFSRN